MSSKALDGALTPLSQCRDQGSRDFAITALLQDFARPLVRSILLSRMSSGGSPIDCQELDDLESEAVVQLITRLERLASDPIADFRAYLAVVVYNTWNAYLRRKYPRRWRLDSKLRYLLSHDPRFAMWISERGESFSSLAEFRRGAPALAQRVDHAITAIAPGSFTDVVERILRHVGSPLPIDDLVHAVGAVLAIKDNPVQEASDQMPANDSGSAVDDRLDRRTLLQAVWREVHDLPLPQKSALLLGLRGEGGEALMPFLLLMGVATLHQLASALEITTAELAALWKKLPLDDITIAGRLGLTRQQVINLRKSARERLARRLRVQREQTP